MQDRKSVRDGGMALGAAMLFLFAGGIGLNWWFVALAGFIGAVIGAVAADKGWAAGNSKEADDRRERERLH